ncbi:enoyl-CoA hydratase-related protein [Nocardioides pocheonensis]|uniref:enoyl-CoA hydratase n=1 Tax=Nocardioides pocheonensis TaxID=661485 RepID=A0A3N0GJF4_9ACTN|nr:enoyl-CoA hydratase-related protein [Nocardioides pocheonensis]RNM12180.1 enoyl-CoA hydratase [Nocardioides pocheonensis]
MPTSGVRLEEAGANVRVLVIDRVERRNALSIAVKDRIADLVEVLDNDPGVKVIVVTGGPSVFVAGTDVEEMSRLTPTEHTLMATDRMFRVLRACRTPLIAAVDGYALGGGFELALSCDLIVAGAGARFGLPEIRVGVMPGAGGTQRLVRLLGKYQALRLVLTGDHITGTQAHAMGVVSDVTDDGAALARALELAEVIAAMPQLAVQAILEVVEVGAEAPIDVALVLERRAFQLLFDTEDQKEGMRAFLEKRSPEFQNR